MTTFTYLLLLLHLLLLAQSLLLCASSTENNNNGGSSSSTTTTCAATADNNDHDGDGNCAEETANRKNNINSSQKDDRCASSSSSRGDFRWDTGKLHPNDLPGPEMFSNFHNNSSIMVLPSGAKVSYADGSVMQINKLDAAAGTITSENDNKKEKGQTSSSSSSNGFSAEVSLISQAMPRSNSSAIVELIKKFMLHQELDSDPDTVDGMPSYEIFVDTHTMAEERQNFRNQQTTKVLDTDPDALKHRDKLRDNIKAITQPILDEVLTPFVRERFPKLCQKKGIGRKCTPCYSLIRRYKHGERQSHAIHHDSHAIVTVVVSLSDYGKDYLGGLYVSTGHGQRQFLPLEKGDAAVHSSMLLHGVKVLDQKDNPHDTERWSWILWYRDSETCQDHKAEWFKKCSDAGNAICQELQASNGATTHQEMVALNSRAAEAGSGGAAIKMARAYLGTLHSHLEFDLDQAKRYFRIATASNNPEGHYGLAGILVIESHAATSQAHQNEILAQAIKHLETGALADHAYSMFNLGIAHIYGYGMPNNKVDMELGALWLARSGLPEGYFVASNYAHSIGDEDRYELWGKRAHVLGYHQPWRKQARHHTGSGGAGGVDLNLKWPKSTARGGMVPPEF